MLHPMAFHRRLAVLLLTALLANCATVPTPTVPNPTVPTPRVQPPVPRGVLQAELRIFLVARMTPLLERTPNELSRDAFSSEYGRAVVLEVGRIFQASADAGCLRSRPMDAAGFAQSARELLVDYGASLIEKHRTAAAPEKFEAAFAARAGAGWNMEIASLREDADVRRYLELREPLVLASVVEDTAEILDRYLVLERNKLSASLYPLASTSEAVRHAIPYETSGNAVRGFMKEKNSPRIERWEELEQAASDAWLESVSDEALRALLRPRELVPEFGSQLRGLCVGQR